MLLMRKLIEKHLQLMLFGSSKMENFQEKKFPTIRASFLIKFLFNHAALHRIEGTTVKTYSGKRNMKEDSNKGKQSLKEATPSKKPGKRDK